jgi:hypothetical protein
LEICFESCSRDVDDRRLSSGPIFDIKAARAVGLTAERGGRRGK